MTRSGAELFCLEGRIACVTGASSGIGRYAASLLASHGARVVGVARRTQQLDTWASETDGETAVVTADLSDRAHVRAAATQMAQAFGPPEILINAAGVNIRQPADDVTDDGWDLTLALNLSAPFFLAQALSAGMSANGRGRIINIASLQSRRAFPGGIAYGASKGGVEQLTRAMAEAWSKRGITANAIAPGFFPTELTAPVFSNPALSDHNAGQTCIGRNGEMADLDGPLVFLCSDASAYVTGQTLFVDGGFTAK